jgi:DNA-binding MarR family transcriptional regulator
MCSATNPTGEATVTGPTAELTLRLRDLGRSIRLIKQCRDAATVPTGLLGLLTHVGEQSDGCHARELAARAGLDPSTVSRTVAALVAQGLVERRADQRDGRASVLALTPAGEAALDDAHRRYGELLDRALAGWTPDEIAALAAALGRFAHDIDRTLGHPRPRTESLEAAR